MEALAIVALLFGLRRGWKQGQNDDRNLGH